MPAQKEPTRFTARFSTVEAKPFYGTSESGREIVQWVFGLGGEASWTEATPAIDNGPGEDGCPASPAELHVRTRTPDGNIRVERVEKRSWIVLSEDGWAVFDDNSFIERYIETPVIPRRIVADYERRTLTVDGQQFPFPVSDEFPLEARSFGPIQVVRVPICADEVRFIGTPPK